MEVNHYRRPARGRSKETDESAGDGGDFHGHLLVAYGLSGALVDSTGSHSRCNYVVTKLEIELQMIDSQRVGGQDSRRFSTLRDSALPSPVTFQKKRAGDPRRYSRPRPSTRGKEPALFCQEALTNF